MCILEMVKDFSNLPSLVEIEGHEDGPKYAKSLDTST